MVCIFIGIYSSNWIIKLSCLPGLGKVGGVVDDETESCNPPGLANVGLKKTTKNGWTNLGKLSKFGNTVSCF